jgi:hypothetical protein
MVAIVVSEELQVTEAVRSFVEASLYAPVAVNCRVAPTAILAEGGVTAMDVSVGPPMLAKFATMLALPATE